jgi:hypothetical protein
LSKNLAQMYLYRTAISRFTLDNKWIKATPAFNKELVSLNVKFYLTEKMILYFKNLIKPEKKSLSTLKMEL